MKNQQLKNTTFLFQDAIKKVFSRVYEGIKCSESITKYISNFYIENLLTYSNEKTMIAWSFLLFPQKKGGK